MNPYTLEQLMTGALVIGVMAGVMLCLIVLEAKRFFSQKKIVPNDYDNQGA